MKSSGLALKGFKVMIQGDDPLVSAIVAILTADQTMGIIYLLTRWSRP